MGSLLGSILGVPRNSENSSPSCTKTIVLQIWRGPVWYLLALLFEGRFLASLFHVFYEFSDILGVSLGPVWRQFSCFFLVRPHGVPKRCFGEAKVTSLGTV